MFKRLKMMVNNSDYCCRWLSFVISQQTILLYLWFRKKAMKKPIQETGE